MKTVASLLLLFVSFSFASGADNDRERQENDACELVFRQHFGKPEWRQVFFISIRGKDPSDEFMKRFAEDKTRVYKHSLAITDSNGTARHKETRVDGTLLFVERIEWKSDTELAVKAGCLNGPRAGTRYTVTLKREGDGWRAVAKKVNGFY